MQPNSLRLAALVTAGLLLLPSLGQAAPPPERPIQLNAATGDTAAVTTAAPGRDDQDLINLGGYPAVDAARTKMAAANAAAAALAAPAAAPKAAAAPVQLRTAAKAPAPKTPTSLKLAARAAQPAPALKPTQAVQTYTPSSSTVRAAGVSGDVSVQVAQDTFYYKNPIATTVTVTKNGAAAASARVWVENQGPIIADANGVAQINLPALNRWSVLPIRVEAADFTWSADNVAELYVWEDGQQVTVVNQVTDEAGQPVQGFDFQVYGANGGSWGKGTHTDSAGIVFRADELYMEVTPWEPNGPSNLLIASHVPQGTDVRRNLHPSGSDAAPVHVTATLDGTPIDGNVTMHLAGEPGISWPGRLGTIFRATPGTYNLVLSANTATESVLLPRAGIAVTPAGTANVDFAVTRAELGALNLQVRDGWNNSTDGGARFILGDAMGNVGSYAPVFMPPGNALLNDYDVNINSGPDDWWNFGFNARYGARQPVPVTAGQTGNLALGGQITPTMAPTATTCSGSPCQIAMQVRLWTPEGDLLSQVRHKFNQIQGTVRLYKLEGGTASLVAEQSFDPGWNGGHPDVYFQLPDVAAGSYRASMEIDLGPYQGMIATDTTFTVTDPTAYQITVTPQQLPPNSSQTVTVHVADQGAPVANQMVKLGWGREYGTVNTDANGNATFYVHTNNNRDVIPVWIPGEGRDVRVDNVYVVPAGYTVVTVREVRDQNGIPVRNFQVGAGWSDTQGNSDNHRDWSETGTIGVVRPVGSNDIDVWTENGQTGVYLYQKVDVGATPFDLYFGGAGAKYLTAHATVNGQSFTGGLYVHNLAKSGPTEMNNPLPSELYVTPGHYDVVVVSNEPATRSLQLSQNVDLTTGGVILMLLPTTLARVESLVTDASGNPFSDQGWDRLELPNFSLTIQHGLNHAITPGVPVKVVQFERYVNAPTGGEFEYRFNNEDGTAPAPLQPGQTLQVHAGSTLHGQLIPGPNPPQPGRDFQVFVGLYDSYGNRVEPMQNWGSLPANLWLDNADHNPVWQQPIWPWERDRWVPIPGNANGDYTLGAEWMGGAAFNSPGAQLPIHVEPAVWLNVNVSPQVLQPDQSTPVTITLTHNGAPYTNATVFIPSKGQLTPDANGQINTTVTIPGGTAWPIEARAANGTLVGKANLFGLWSNQAGVELTGTNNNGNPLGSFWGTAESVVNPEQTRRTEWTENGPVGLVVQAGPTDLQVATEGRDLYLIGSRADLPGGQLTRLTLDGTQTMTMYLYANLDGQPLDNGQIGLRRQGNLGPSWLRGLELDGNGGGIIHVTPDTYDTVVSWHQNTIHYINSFGLLSYFPGTETSRTFTLNQANLTPLTFSAITAAGAQCPGVALKIGGVQSWAQPACTVYAAPGTYSMDTLRYSLPQANGQTWEYSTRRDQPVTINVAPGQPQSFTYDMAVTDVSVDLSPNPYKPGNWLNYRLNVGTADGWVIREVEDRETRQRMAPQTIELRDAAGNLMPIGYDEYSEWNNWPVPGNPSPSYTVSISRNLGALGGYSASGITKLQSSVKYRLVLDKEVLPVGQMTAINLTLTGDGMAIPGARVMVYGDTVLEKRTDGRGHIDLAIRPQSVNIWMVEYVPEGGSPVRGYLYAIDNRYGVVGAKTFDQDGKALRWYYLDTDESLFGTATCSGTDCRKLIVPAGKQISVAVKGRSNSGSGYSMVAQTYVKPLATNMVTVDTKTTVPLNVTLNNQVPGTQFAIALHPTAVKYKENLWFYVDIRPLFVSPGTYDAAIVAYAGRTAYVVPTTFTATAGSPAATTGDIAAATGTIQPSLHLGDGAPWANYIYYLGYDPGFRFDFSAQDTDQVMVVPGNWSAQGFDVELGNGPESWRYEFTGRLPLTVSAGQTLPLNLGGPLTGVAEPAQSPNLVNGTVLLRGVARDQSGFALTRTTVFDAYTGWYLRNVASQLTVTGPGGYNASFQYDGDQVKWLAPATAGTYSLNFSRLIGPYGPTATGQGTVQLIRLVR